MSVRRGNKMSRRQIQREQFFKNFIIAHGGVPAVGGEDCRVEFAVRVVEPRRALVVEIRQRALD